MPFGKILVGIANKHARQIWATLAYDVDYDPCACLNHPMHQQTYTLTWLGSKILIHRLLEPIGKQHRVQRDRRSAGFVASAAAMAVIIDGDRKVTRATKARP